MSVWRGGGVRAGARESLCVCVCVCVCVCLCMFVCASLYSCLVVIEH